MAKLREPQFCKYEPDRKLAFHDHKKNEYAPYPHQRPGPDANKSQKTNIEPDVRLRKFNKAKHAVQDLDKIEWDKIKAIELSDGGSQGVIFVETDEGAFVLKGSTDVAVEFYLQQLQKILKIPVPQMQLIKWTDPNFYTVTSEVERAAFSDELLHFRTKPRLDVAYLLLMEYIPGISIEGMGRPRAQRVFTHLSPEARDRLIRLGFILAFDTYINNYDRFPCGAIWDNEGNPGNVVLRAKTGYTTSQDQLNDQNDGELQFEKFYALDPRISQVNVRQDHTKQMLEKYYGKVETFFNDIFMELKGVMEAKIDPIKDIQGHKFSSVKRFVDLIFNYTGYYMQELQILQVMIGIGICMHNIVELGIDRVGQLFIKQYVDKKQDWQGFYNKNLELINIEVLADVLKIYVKLAGVYPDVIKWLHDITLGEYKVNILDWEKAMGIYEGDDQEREDQQIQSQYMGEEEKKGSDDEDDEDGDGHLTDEEYDKDDDIKRKINDIFYLDMNQLEEDVKKGRDIDHYNKNPKELAQMKPDIYQN